MQEKKPRGQPPKPPEKRKDRPLFIRLEEEDWDTLEKLAPGRLKPQWIRDRIREARF